ncbi:hypothetical protein Lser_V15G19705 [Lactuca serriola]
MKSSTLGRFLHPWFGGVTSSSHIIIEDEKEEVVYRPPLVSSDPPAVSSVQTNSSESSPQQPSPDADATPLTPVKREFMNQETSVVTSNLMELLFPERIADEFVAYPTNEPSSSTVDHSANEGVVNIHNLPVSINDISHEIPARIQRDHPIENVIGQLCDGVQTRSQCGDVNTCLSSCFISQIEPKNVEMDLNEPSWFDAMHDELNQFEKLGVWKLVELLEGKKSLDTRWVFRNKQDDSGVIVWNKARLVVRGFRQIEGLDYTEVYAPVALLEAIRIFLAYASYMNFTVYQMDVKTAFLYGKVKEDIYVDQPTGFVNLKLSNHVYKLDNALYGLHQAPRA